MRGRNLIRVSYSLTSAQRGPQRQKGRPFLECQNPAMPSPATIKLSEAGQPYGEGVASFMRKEHSPVVIPKSLSRSKSWYLMQRLEFRM
jgi:hypothetical protein